MTRNLPGRLVWNEKECHEEIDMDFKNENSETELGKSLSSINCERPPSNNVAPSNTQGPLDWYNLISSEEWLRIHGLKTKKLTLSHILSQIGFPHQEDYIYSIGKIVASRYADGLFRQFCKAEDGTIYRVTAKTQLIYPYVTFLNDAVECFKERMNWLTSGSRQIFGVILEQCITIVLDFGSLDEEEFSLCQDALVMVIDEQVAHLTKFNLIRAAQNIHKWRHESVIASEYHIDSAIKWIKNLTCQHSVASDSAINAIREAKRDDSNQPSSSLQQRKKIDLINELIAYRFLSFLIIFAWIFWLALALKSKQRVVAIYYFLVGNVLEDSKKSLLHSAAESSHPVHTVSFNAQGEDTVTFLKKLSTSSKGRFHAFAARIVPLGIPEPSAEDGTFSFSSNLRKLKGRIPPDISRVTLGKSLHFVCLSFLICKMIWRRK